LTALLAGVSAGAWAWEVDWDLDREMKVLERPVWRPIILPYGDGAQRGAPQSAAWIYYKQQPPGAQGDFRNLLPGGAGTPGGVPELPGSGGPLNESQGTGDGTVADGGTGGGGTSGGGGTGSGGGNGNNGNQPPGPQLPPPDMGGPSIPTDPIPLPPPGPF